MVGAVSLIALLPRSAWAGDKLAEVKKSLYTVPEELTSYEDVTQYNNFYEFGTSKEDPTTNAGSLKTRPWTVTIEGEVKKIEGFRY